MNTAHAHRLMESQLLPQSILASIRVGPRIAFVHLLSSRQPLGHALLERLARIDHCDVYRGQLHELAHPCISLRPIIRLLLHLIWTTRGNVANLFASATLLIEDSCVTQNLLFSFERRFNRVSQ